VVGSNQTRRQSSNLTHQSRFKGLLLVIDGAGLGIGPDRLNHTPWQRTHPGMRQERLTRGHGEFVSS
jgi:hypothetical protein